MINKRSLSWGVPAEDGMQKIYIWYEKASNRKIGIQLYSTKSYDYLYTLRFHM